MLSSLIAFALVAVGALAQETPPGTTPAVSNPLSLQYGSVSVSPGTLFSPPGTYLAQKSMTSSKGHRINDGSWLTVTAVKQSPIVSSTTKYNGTYMLYMLDLDIKFSQVVKNASNTSAYDSLTPGYGPQRTTKLHWWSGNLTQSANGSFVKSNGSPDPAPYDSPAPPPGDMAHAYAFYLFPQPANYTLPAVAVAGTYTDLKAPARLNYTLAGTIAAVGQPIAGNYMRVQNTTNSTTGSPINPSNGAGKLTVSAALTGAAALAFAAFM